MRWTIFRSPLLLLGLVAGLALAARKKGDPSPTPEPAPVEAAPAEAPPPAPPPPTLFSGALPIALQQTPDGLASLSAQACAGCHISAHEAWTGTAHAAAWRDATFQAALARVGESTACRSCHLPLANQHPRLATGYRDGDLTRPDLQPNTAWDPTLMSEGVTCAACHIRDGVVLSTHESPGAPHPVVATAELSSPELCASCHQLTWPGADRPFYDTYGEWKASAYAAAGVRCQDCHMPPTAGVAIATRYAAQPDHAFQADPGRALSVLVSLDAPEVQRGQPYDVRLKLQNTGAGHHIPTGSPFQTYTVQVELLDTEGKPLAAPWAIPLARTVADAPPWSTLSDTRLAAGEERSVDHAFLVDQRKKAGAALLRVSLLRGSGAGDATALQEIPLSVF